MDEQQAADLFAFFYSLRFFEEPGDCRARQISFHFAKCAACHGIDEPEAGDARVKPVAEWTRPSDPLELVETMWNHSAPCATRWRARNIRLPQLTGQDLADLLVIRAGPPRRQPPAASPQ